MGQESTNKTDVIEAYYERCKRMAIGLLVIAVVSSIVGMLVIIKLIEISFSTNLSILQVCLFILLTLITLGIAGTAVSLHIFT